MAYDMKKDYEEKSAYLSECYEELTPKGFYRALFPVGSFQQLGNMEEEKPNGLALEIEGSKAKYYIVTDGLEMIDELTRKDFVIMSAISYYGRSRKGANARFLYALTFDIDAVGIRQLRDLLYQAKNKVIPMPTYVVNSGGGVHLYYQFREPVPMYPRHQEYLRKLKHCLTKRIWNDYTSNREDIEYQSPLQGFRVVGSSSKLGREYPVRAYLTGEKVDIEYLYSFLLDSDKKEIGLLEAYAHSGITLEEAKKLYPDWYESKIIKGHKKGRWYVKRDLYDWWKRKIEKEIKLHHRYFAIMALAIYAAKCNISEDELRQDAYSLLAAFDNLTETEDNHFTRDDIEAALTTYNEDYITFPRDTIARLTDIYIKENKRNGRKQEVHMKIMSSIRDVLYPDGEWRRNNGGGRPSKEKEIREYLAAHPNAKKGEIKAALGVSYTTIAKYLAIIESEGEKQE